MIYSFIRGGDTNAVWPIISLIREFDSDFEVIIPFRAHSAGTLLSLGSNKIIMSKLAELSPIDPSTGNSFNPIDEQSPNKRLGISVEDVNAFKEFIKETFKIENEKKYSEIDIKIINDYITQLINKIHPLAIGNVHRVHKLIQKIAKKILSLHSKEKSLNIDKIINSITVEPYSHLHMFSREEAKEILGDKFIECANKELDDKIDELLKNYEDDFNLRSTLFLNNLIGGSELEKEFRFIGGVLESYKWGYIFETCGKIYQYTKLPNNVNLQIPPGQQMPLIQGLPKGYEIVVNEQKWSRNVEPKGVTK